MILKENCTDGIQRTDLLLYKPNFLKYVNSWNSRQKLIDSKSVRYLTISRHNQKEICRTKFNNRFSLE